MVIQPSELAQREAQQAALAHVRGALHRAGYGVEDIVAALWLRSTDTNDVFWVAFLSTDADLGYDEGTVYVSKATNKADF
jgi:hypothetical protein